MSTNKPHPMVVGSLGAFFIAFRRRHTHCITRQSLRDSIRTIRQYAGRDTRAPALDELRARGFGRFA